MIKKISILLTNFIMKNKSLDDDERLVYEYCIRIILKRSLWVLLLLMLGIMTNRIIVSLLFILTFIPLRTFCGGAHASTSTICSILSYGISLTIIMLSPLLGELIPFIYVLIFFIFFIMPILLLAPVDTKNKRLNPIQKKCLRTKCFIHILLLVTLFFVFSMSQTKTYCMTLSLCVIICSINVIIGFFQNRRNHNEH